MNPVLFDFELPPDLIAQEPAARRDESRLLIVHRATGVLTHGRVNQLAQWLKPGDLLILNDTRVLPARLVGQRVPTGGKWEGLYLRTLPDGAWEMLCQTGGRPRPGELVAVNSPRADEFCLQLRLDDKLGQGAWKVRPLHEGNADDILQRFGSMPLPPYIRKGRAGPEDLDRYQTVYARRAGAVAAPTAGLHFTPDLFARLSEQGIGRDFVTLHVGLGTFQPIQCDDPTQHVMHAEWGELSAKTAQTVNDCKARQGRVVAVGSTSLRVLETAARASLGGQAPGSSGAKLAAWTGDTNLFIYPPYSFGAVDALLTNFHLPRTTLLMLVCAFAGVQLAERAYREAVAQRYRFFSYGDAMLVL